MLVMWFYPKFLFINLNLNHRDLGLKFWKEALSSICCFYPYKAKDTQIKRSQLWKVDMRTNLG